MTQVDTVTEAAVEAALEHSHLEAGGSVDADGIEFGFRVPVDPATVTVTKPDDISGLRLATHVELDAELVAAIVEDDALRREFTTQLGYILATNPGGYAFMGESGATTNLRETRSVYLEQWVYGDGLTQDRLLRRIEQLSTLGLLVLQLGNLTRGEVENL